ncbi:MAG TPA: hypothetical protein VJ673_05670 [Aromatoleum sp.]|nr:hypothetical protein [Aromatoleum sp.]HJV25152.1 hypothetical protein [Aromatoleum sp.]
MKLRETVFFKQLVAVIVGTVLVVSTSAFVSIPLSLAASGAATHLC